MTGAPARQLGAVNDLTVALTNYGGVVIQAGYNRAVAENNATPGGRGPAPQRPPQAASTAGVLTADEFEARFLSYFKSGRNQVVGDQFDVLDRLVADVDEYVGDPHCGLRAKELMRTNSDHGLAEPTSDCLGTSDDGVPICYNRIEAK